MKHSQPPSHHFEVQTEADTARNPQHCVVTCLTGHMLPHACGPCVPSWLHHLFRLNDFHFLSSILFKPRNPPISQHTKFLRPSAAALRHFTQSSGRKQSIPQKITCSPTNLLSQSGQLFLRKCTLTNPLAAFESMLRWLVLNKALDATASSTATH